MNKELIPIYLGKVIDNTWTIKDPYIMIETVHDNLNDSLIKSKSNISTISIQLDLQFFPLFFMPFSTYQKWESN